MASNSFGHMASDKKGSNKFTCNYDNEMLIDSRMTLAGGTYTTFSIY